MAAPNEPKMDQKRNVTAAENGTSESGKERLWQSFAYAYTKVWAGLGWAPEPTLQNRETQRHGGPKQAKNGPKTERYGGREWHL